MERLDPSILSIRLPIRQGPMAPHHLGFLPTLLLRCTPALPGAFSLPVTRALAWLKGTGKGLLHEDRTSHCRRHSLKLRPLLQGWIGTARQSRFSAIFSPEYSSKTVISWIG